MGAINIPHASDPFPHLQAYVDDCRQQWSADRREAIAVMDNSGGGQRTSRADRAARRAERTQRRG